jgi:hypothetical protein
MLQFKIRSLIPFAILPSIHALSTGSPECALVADVVDKLLLAPSATAYCSSLLQLSTVTVTNVLSQTSTQLVTSVIKTVPTSIVSVTESITAGTVTTTASAATMFITE